MSQLSFVPTLLQWFMKNQRPLPWRNNYHPYSVLVSEMMLQQTQMERVVQYYERWMGLFPTVADLARAPEERVLQAWEGLGYYRRARFLHAAAKSIMDKHGGEIPANHADLLALPGLGSYTAAAVAGIAFNQDIPCIDANVDRVFARLFNIESPPRKKPAATVIAQLAQQHLPKGQARWYNQALMEFGALLCSKKPKCEACPLEEWCTSLALGVQNMRPVLEKPTPTLHVLSAHALVRLQGQVWLRRRPATGLWGNLWEFPGLDIVCSTKKSSLAQADILQALEKYLQNYGLTVQSASLVTTVKHSYTRHRALAYFFEIQIEKPLPEHFSLLPISQAKLLPLPSHHRKAWGRQMPKHLPNIS